MTHEAVAKVEGLQGDGVGVCEPRDHEERRILGEALVIRAVWALQTDPEVAVTQKELGKVLRAQRDKPLLSTRDDGEVEVLSRPFFARELTEEVAVADEVLTYVDRSEFDDVHATSSQLKGARAPGCPILAGMYRPLNHRLAAVLLAADGVQRGGTLQHALAFPPGHSPRHGWPERDRAWCWRTSDRTCEPVRDEPGTALGPSPTGAQDRRQVRRDPQHALAA